MKALTWETVRFDLSDGRELLYNVVGTGMPVLLLNGLGGSREIWAELVEHLQDRYRFITFDYSGLRGGAVGPVQAHTISLHARDAVAILQRESVTRCAVVGWSMGVSVALELFAQAPSSVASLALICGGVRASWSRSTLQSLPAAWLWRILRLLRRKPRLSQRLLKLGLQSPEAFTWARRLGLMGEQISEDLFARMTAALLEYDLSSYVGALDGLTEYDASHVLPLVDVPTLVIGGGHDPFTSRAGLEELAQGIAGAEYLFIPEGTHYLLLDQAEWVNLRLEKFWNERGYAAT
jgi:3-oxoadipate enol-lactonase/4-carboxymuconolactone decarboxylase